jgi:CRISPR/Cas system-associated exonuclease Cas4 (RecB family)
MSQYSLSQIYTFNSCPRKWELNYKEYLDRIRHSPDRMKRGTVIHRGLEYAMRSFFDTYKAHPDKSALYHLDQAIIAALVGIEEASQENRPDHPIMIGDMEVEIDYNELAEWDGMVAECKTIVLRTLYHLNFHDTYRVVGYNGKPMVELEVVAPVEEYGFEFSGTIDVVLHNIQDGTLEVVDWKTTTSFRTEHEEMMNSQLGVYAYILSRMLGASVDVGTIYNIYSNPPKSPKINKDGTVSRANIRTDWETYAEAVRSAGGDPDDYLDMKEKLDGYEWFSVVRVYRSEETQRRLWLNAVAGALNIHEATKYPRAWNSFHCGSCKFMEYCKGELYGLRTEDMIGTIYEYVDKVEEDTNDNSEV